MTKRNLGVALLLAIVIWLIATYWKPKTDHTGCIEVTESMTVKEARDIETICDQKIEQLQQDRQELEDQQTELSQQADYYRELLANSPFMKLRNEPKLQEMTKLWLLVR